MYIVEYVYYSNANVLNCNFSRNPLEVTEEFVYQYNNAKSLDEREKYESTAHKMLERSKVIYI